MGRLSLLKLVWILLACICLSEAGADSKEGNVKVKGAVLKDAKKSASNAKTEQLWGSTKPAKTSLKRETLPIPSSKGGRTSSESLRTASQTLFGYNGANNNGYNGGYNNGGQFGGVGGAQGGFNNGYSGYPGGRQFAGFGGGNGYNQYSQLGTQGYNVLNQGQGQLFGGQGQGGQYYPNNGYFGGAANYNQYNPYASTGAYPFAGLAQNGFGGGQFGGYNSGFGNGGYYPGGAQGYPGQVGNRNFGFINQGFGNPAFRNPQAGSAAISGGSSGINSLPNHVQVGTGLEVGSRGFGSSRGSTGGFPSASGQQYIVGNGIGQPAFIGGLMNGVGVGANPEFGSPFGGGLYSPGIPGGLYRNQIRPSNSIFGLGPYDYPRTLSSPSPSPSRPGSTKLQTSSPNRFYQGVRPGGTYTPNSRERLYRYTSNES